MAITTPDEKFSMLGMDIPFVSTLPTRIFDQGNGILLTDKFADRIADLQHLIGKSTGVVTFFAVAAAVQKVFTAANFKWGQQRGTRFGL